MVDFDVCENCGGLETRSSSYGPPPRKRVQDDNPLRHAVIMGYFVKPLRCPHCEWDDRLLPGTPAEAGLHSLRRLFRKGLIDNAEFLARERALLLELLGIDSLEVVPGTIKSEIAAHIASRRAEVPDPDSGDDVPVQRFFPGTVTMDELITGYDVGTGFATVRIDIRRIIKLFGADAPGPFTAMWIRVAKLDDATTHGFSVVEMLHNLAKDWRSDQDLEIDRRGNDD